MDKKEKTNSYYLEYLDNAGNIRNELKKVLVNEEDRKNCEVEKFLKLLNDFIIETLDKNKYDILKQFISYADKLCFGTIYYILIINSNLNDKSIGNLKKYIDKQVDLYMIFNFIREDKIKNHI